MNKYDELEKAFLLQYPQGFQSEEMIQMGKKHKLGQLNELVQEAFSKENFESPEIIIEASKKLINKSTLVSRFEKPDFKRFIDNHAHMDYVKALYNLYYGNQKEGFENLVAILHPFKLAKWPVISAFLSYMDLDKEVFIKPTTAKKIVSYFEWQEVHYQSMPTYEFYLYFKDKINALKEDAHPSLQVYNPAFCGFLMLAIDNLYS